MNDKGFKIGVLVAVIAMVVVVGVGFAAFTTTLNINGTAKVEASSWNVHFYQDPNGCALTNHCFTKGNTQTGITSTTTVVKEPTLTDTTISDWDVTFKTPGDNITYEFYVKNDGSFDAKISTFELPTPTCTGTGDNAETDAANVCKHLEYSLITDLTPPSDVAVGNTLNKSETKTLILTLRYKADITTEELPKGDVSISNLGFSIVYTQA